MRSFSFGKVVFALVVLGLIFSVFMLLLTMNTITNVSAVEAEGVGVYWDSGCKDAVSSINWGTLTPGSSRNIDVYIQNQKEEPVFLIMSTTNWNPSKASNYITLRWNYNVRQVDPHEAIQITLTLSVSRYTEGISNFSFDIIITASQRLPGDVNGDGKVTITDLVVVYNIYSGIPVANPDWIPYCDVNFDGSVDISDVKVERNIYSGVA